VVSSTFRLLYSRFPLDRRLGGARNRSGRCEEKKNLTSTGNRILAVRSVVIPTPFVYKNWMQNRNSSVSVVSTTMLRAGDPEV
jgi:hypothetical protein